MAGCGLLSTGTWRLGLALAAFFVALGGFITATTGFSFQPLLYRFPPSKIFIVVIILSLLAWGFKILLHKGML